MAEVGEQAPDFALPSTAGAVRLSEATAQGKVVLAFYYEDATPTCSSEVSMLKDDYEMIRGLEAEVVAVSADGLESHEAFEERLGGVPFALASDEELDNRLIGVHLPSCLELNLSYSLRSAPSINRLA